MAAEAEHGDSSWTPGLLEKDVALCSVEGGSWVCGAGVALLAAVRDGGAEAVSKVLQPLAARPDRHKALLWTDRSGGSPLQRAAGLGKLGALVALIRPGDGGDSGSHWWTRYATDLLLAKDARGRTALHFAAEAGHADVMGWVLEHVPEQLVLPLLLAADGHGATPLHAAVRGGHAACVATIVAGATRRLAPRMAKEEKKEREEGEGGDALRTVVVARDRGGSTALHYAARHKHVEAAAALLDAVSDDARHAGTVSAATDAANTSGTTPLMWAAQLGSSAMVRLLIEQGADVCATANDGATAADKARARGDAVGEELVDVLLSAAGVRAEG